MEYFLNKENVKKYITEVKEHPSPINPLEILQNFLPKGKSLLELGMGTGSDLELLSSYYNVTGSDYSEYFINYYKQQNKNNIPLLHLNAIDIKTNNKFDCIYSNKVLFCLNTNNLKLSFKRQAQILNKNGFIFHTLWYNGTDSKEEFANNTLNVYMHSYNTLKEILAENNFVIKKFEKYKEFENNDSVIVIAQKQ